MNMRLAAAAWVCLHHLNGATYEPGFEKCTQIVAEDRAQARAEDAARRRAARDIDKALVGQAAASHP